MMGAIFSRTRSPATELERISLEIGDLKQKLENISKKQSSVLYYFCMMMFTIVTVMIAHTWLRYEQPTKTYYVGAITFGALTFIVIGRYIVKSFFTWRTTSTTKRLEHSISQKEVLLDLVRDTLKFKEAKEILDRYDIKEDEKNMTMVNRSAPASPMINRPPRGNFENEKQSQNSPKIENISLRKEEATSPGQLKTPLRTPHVGSRANAEPIRPYLRQSGAIDRILDYFMSDGPGCRNALICTICHTHNGMAIPAEYPFISFRCFECGHMNPSKIAPQNVPIRAPTNQAIIRPTVIGQPNVTKEKRNKPANESEKATEKQNNKE